MFCDFLITRMLVTVLIFINVSTSSDTNAAEADATNTCASMVNCTCQLDVIQCHDLSSLNTLPPAPTVKRLVLRDSPILLLNATLLQHLPQLQTLELINCSLLNTTGTWQNTQLEVLNLSGNNLTKFNLQWLDTLPGLKSLNLSGNPLRSVVGHRTVESRLLSMDLSGRHWNCTEQSMTWLIDWLRLPPPRTLAGEADTRCGEARKKRYSTMDGRRMVDVLRVTDDTLKRCPSEPPFGCSCDLIQVDGPSSSPTPAASMTQGGGGPLFPVIVEVYCDNRNLSVFPPKLPINTTRLYIRNNSLTSFGEVIGNLSSYQAITELFLDGNLLEADDANRLEGSAFLDRFSILSLSRNRLQTDWVASQYKLIRDADNVRCGSGPLAGDTPPGPLLTDLVQQELCSRLHINTWDVTIGLLALVLLMLIIMFGHDYIVYRRTGGLPLIVRKFPC